MKLSFFCKLTEDIPGGTCIIRNGQVISADSNFLKMFEISRDDLENFKWGAYFPGKSDEIKEMLKRVSVGLLRDEMELESELGGNSLPLKAVFGGMLGGESNLVTGTFHYKEELEEKAHKINMLVSTMRTNSEGIVITDPEGTILWVNDAFSRITGYPPEEAVGKNPRVLKSGLHPKSFYVRMWTEIKEKGYWQSDIYNRRKNGEVYSEFLSIQAIPNEQREIAYFLARMSDITYLKKFEKEMTNELTLAQRIQKNILPQSKPDFPGVDFQCIYNPMEAIGGDFYDFIKLDEERMGIFISDISGHGVPAALITTMTKAILESSENYLLSPSLLMSYLNKRLVSLNGDMFLTGVYAVYHKRLRTLTFSRCAHPHPVIIRNGELIYLEENGSGMLGVFKDMVFNKATVELQKGDKVVFYTDGLTEGLSPDMVEFSTIFSDVLKQFSDLPVEKYIERIYYSFLIHCEQNILEDDVCLIGMEVTE